ncbi:sensor histidine kinase [Pontibacter pudoricolor]|uniref:sensor histidine kinase n=1 Tax=Pontibacter pudoricolor TaxID=2694930 RepID=UPI00139097C8|nr:GAF domain-containing sensor histidine kinase [Pontibacter pudoricolor]
MIDSNDKLFKDLEAVRQIPIVPTMLEVICQITGMGFAAIARVTHDRWLACSVRDEVEFGLKEGGELKIETTLCNEIRDSRKAIVIDNVEEDPLYKHHHTPQMYGLQSYISIPIILKDGTFFGTLCAIDSKPAKVNNAKVINTFNLFAELLSFHLQSLNLLERSYTTNVELNQQNKLLTSANFDLDNFVYTASHDLKSPVANIEGLLEILSESVEQETIDKEEIKQVTQLMKSSLKRFTTTINDLTTIVSTDQNRDDHVYEEIDFCELVESVKQDLYAQIDESGAHIKVVCGESISLNFSKKNFKSILYNLINNAIKYRSPERTPDVLVMLEKSDDSMLLTVSDNGIGIPADKQDKIFTMFKRFHDHVEGSGIGLYIVKRLVDNAAGKVEVSSKVNVGTTIRITL